MFKRRWTALCLGFVLTFTLSTVGACSDDWDDFEDIVDELFDELEDIDGDFCRYADYDCYDGGYHCRGHFDDDWYDWDDDCDDWGDDWDDFYDDLDDWWDD